MYAIFRALGKQFRAEKGKTIRLPLMDAEAGSKVTFDEVLLSSDGETIRAGTPLVSGAKVVAEVVGVGKEPKIYVFKWLQPQRADQQSQVPRHQALRR